jgi:hypothetical protein
MANCIYGSGRMKGSSESASSSSSSQALHSTKARLKRLPNISVPDNDACLEVKVDPATDEKLRSLEKN